MKENKTRALFAISCAALISSFLLLGFTIPTAAQSSCEQDCENEFRNCLSNGLSECKKECEAGNKIDQECMQTCGMQVDSTCGYQHKRCLTQCQKNGEKQ